MKIRVTPELVEAISPNKELLAYLETVAEGCIRDLLGEPVFGPPAPPEYGPPEPDWCSECGETPYPRPPRRTVPPHLAMLTSKESQ